MFRDLKYLVRFRELKYLVMFRDLKYLVRFRKTWLRVLQTLSQCVRRAYSSSLFPRVA